VVFQKYRNARALPNEKIWGRWRLELRTRRRKRW
jgi:hypothetical protein